MVSIARTCQHLHAVAIRVLYRRVELQSLAQADAFFLTSTILRKGSPAEVKHAESKRAQWEAIKVLVLRTGWDDRFRSLGVLPRSLRGGRVKPIDLDELQLIYHDDPRSLHPLLRCFSPRRVVLATTWDRDKGLAKWTRATGWSNVTHLTLIGRHSSATAQLPGASPSSSPFASVKFATLVDRYSWKWYSGANVADSVAGLTSDLCLLLRLCPSLDAIKISSSNESEFKAQIQHAVKDGIAGKPASFFSVEFK